MYPWRRILIPTDFSTAAEWAFDDAIHLAAASGAELIVLHVRMTETRDPATLRFPADNSVYEYAEKVELDTLRERARRTSSSVQTRMIVKNAPHPGSEIRATATQENADLLIIATHARHHVAHLLIGSTTLNVLHDPPVPVLAIRYGIPKRRGMKKIIVPVHTQQTSDAAADLAAEIARRDGAEVHLLIVCGDTERAVAEERVNAVAQRMNDIGAKRAVVSGNDVEQGLVRYVKESHADMVFVNAQKELGTVKRDIIRRIDVPVMIVPA